MLVDRHIAQYNWPGAQPAAKFAVTNGDGDSFNYWDRSLFVRPGTWRAWLLRQLARVQSCGLQWVNLDPATWRAWRLQQLARAYFFTIKWLQIDKLISWLCHCVTSGLPGYQSQAVTVLAHMRQPVQTVNIVTGAAGQLGPLPGDGEANIN